MGRIDAVPLQKRVYGMLCTGAFFSGDQGTMQQILPAFSLRLKLSIGLAVLRDQNQMISGDLLENQGPIPILIPRQADPDLSLLQVL